MDVVEEKEEATKSKEAKESWTPTHWLPNLKHESSVSIAEKLIITAITTSKLNANRRMKGSRFS